MQRTVEFGPAQEIGRELGLTVHASDGVIGASVLQRGALEALRHLRETETGFALGGNKVRKLEFELAPQRLEGISCLITAGGPQSNHCRVTAAFAARSGLRCLLVTQAPEPARRQLPCRARSPS